MTFAFLNIKKLLGAVFLLVFLLLAQSALALEADDQLVAKYGVKYPIAELNNCSSFSQCREVCEDPLNAEVCTNYAKQKGFYKEEQFKIEEKTVIKAKLQLGCDSAESCKTFCQIPTNFDSCDKFAKSNGIVGGRIDNPKDKVVIEQAKSRLGCDSYESCASFCSDDKNRGKCSEFAKDSGLRGGEKVIGPGGCTSEDSCRNFCSDPGNYRTCSGFVSSSGSQFRGPGGCTSEDSCRTYCQSNPQNCASTATQFDQKEMCNRTPRCSWSNNICSCSFGSTKTEADKKVVDEQAKFCKENPQKCTPGGVGGVSSQSERASFDRYCKQNSDKCRPDYNVSYDPRLECQKYEGCSWVNNSCQCSTRYQGATQDNSIWEKSCVFGGCKWTANGCDCASASVDSPALSCGRKQGCSWLDSKCTCSTYNYGATTNSGGGSASTTYATNNYSNYNMPSKEYQEAMCNSGGGSCSWQNDVCNCQNYKSSYSGTSYTNTSTGGTTSSYGNTNTKEQQEAACKAGGGTCDWPNGVCYCKYSGSSSSTTTTGTSTTTTTTNTTPTTAPSGMTRETQEAGCRGCNGTCNWSGDFCSCQCGSTTTSTTTTTTSTPAPVSAPAPVEDDPGTACEKAGCRWAGAQCYCGSTQGVSISPNIFQTFWNWLRDR